eukprot:822032_1
MFASRLDCVQGASEDNIEKPLVKLRATLEEARKRGNTDKDLRTFPDTANIKDDVLDFDVLVEQWTSDLLKIKNGILTNAKSESAFDTLKNALDTLKEVSYMVGVTETIIGDIDTVLDTNVFSGNEKLMKRNLETVKKNAIITKAALNAILDNRKNAVAIAVEFEKAQKDLQALDRQVDSLSDTIQNSENVLKILNGGKFIYDIVDGTDGIKRLRNVGTGRNIPPAPSLNELKASLSKIQSFMVKASTVFQENMKNEITNLPLRFSGEKLIKELKAAHDRTYPAEAALEVNGVSLSDTAYYRNLRKLISRLINKQERIIAGEKSSVLFWDRTMYLLKIMIPVIYVVLIVCLVLYKKGFFKNM